MRLFAVVAMSENRVIGKDNQLPWHLPADLQHFKKVTMGKTIVMGRKTFESIGRPLPGRVNVVISRDENFQAPGCEVVHSIDEALQGREEIFLIGGATLYEQLLPRLDYLYLTLVHAVVEGDTFFPLLDEKEWKEVRREVHEGFSFVEMERRPSAQ